MRGRSFSSITPVRRSRSSTGPPARSRAQIFVAVLGASSYTFYTFAEATRPQGLADWIGSQVRALAYFGGVPEIPVGDNLRSGVSRPYRYERDLNPTYAELTERWILAAQRQRTFFSRAELDARPSPRCSNGSTGTIRPGPPRHRGPRDLLELLDDRHGQHSTLVTSQLRMEHWQEVMGDPTLDDAILDRPVHNAYRITLKGESMRKRKAKNLTATASE